MGEVWRARDSRLHREVAIKVLPGALARDPEHLARFEREARALAALSHANIAEGPPCAGDVHTTPDGEEHWHGGDHDHYMTHVSITHGPASWGDHVTDDEYGHPR